MKTNLNLRKIAALTASSTTLLAVQLLIAIQTIIQRFPAEDVSSWMGVLWYASWEPLLMSVLLSLSAIASGLALCITFSDAYDENDGSSCVSRPAFLYCGLGAILMFLPFSSFFMSLDFGYVFGWSSAFSALVSILDGAKMVLFVYYAIMFLRDYVTFRSFRSACQAKHNGTVVNFGDNEALQAFALDTRYAQFDILFFDQFIQFVSDYDKTEF